jgi:hypothetical protein
MKRVKARQDFIALNLAADESFEDRFTFWARILALNAAMCFRVTQTFTPALHLYGADLRFGFRLRFNSKITHVVAIYRLAR